jgi:nitrogen regulatory protein PII
MKKIEVAIKPFELEAVKESLSELGISTASVAEIRQLAATNAPRRVYRGSAYVSDSILVLRLELVVPAGLVDGIVNAIRRSAKSTCAEDALVLVTEVGEAFRMRSGRCGDAAFAPPAHRPPLESPKAPARAIAWLT